MQAGFCHFCFSDTPAFWGLPFPCETCLTNRNRILPIDRVSLTSEINDIFKWLGFLIIRNFKMQLTPAT